MTTNKKTHVSLAWDIDGSVGADWVVESLINAPLYDHSCQTLHLYHVKLHCTYKALLPAHTKPSPAEDKLNEKALRPKLTVSAFSNRNNLSGRVEHATQANECKPNTFPVFQV